MTPQLRTAGMPSPLVQDTHDDADLPPAIPFDPESARHMAIGGDLMLGEPLALDPFVLKDEAALPGWLVAATRMIRPICVGALMAIPTVGAATVGTVALFDEAAAMHAVAASTAFLAGIPGDIVLLIGALATGYSLSKTVERLKGVRA